MKAYLLLAMLVLIGASTALELSTTPARAQYAPSRNPDDYHAAFVGQNSYPTLRVGACYQFVIQFRNTGRATWYRGVVNLATDRPRDRVPGFIREDRCQGQPSGWIAANRVTLRENSVPPGGVGTFVFSYTVTPDHAVGTFPEYFRPVADGITWMEDCGCYWEVRVAPSPTLQAAVPNSPSSQTPASRLPDTCDSDQNRNNCVYYARCRVSSLPHGLFNYAQKARIINSHTPRVGSVAIVHVGPDGHVAVVEYVHPDGRIQVKEGNYRPGQLTERTGWPAEMRVTGYYQP